MTTLPETKIFAPENGWLEYDCFLLGPGLLSGAMLALGRVFRVCHVMFVVSHGLYLYLLKLPTMDMYTLEWFYNGFVVSNYFNTKRLQNTVKKKRDKR